MPAGVAEQIIKGAGASGCAVPRRVRRAPTRSLPRLQIALQELLGVPVDLLTPGDLPHRARERVLREAVPV
jgi:hypothetical protein